VPPQTVNISLRQTSATFRYDNTILFYQRSERRSAIMSGTSSKQGIDIRDALEILSARSSEEHSHSENGEPGCHHHAPKDANTMGQTLDMNETENQPASIMDESNDDNDNSDQDVQVQQQQLDEERAKRRIEIEAQLQSMTLKELLHAVMDAQQKRVATYRDYEK
jgi:Tfp pilus assembly major pilin PilA